MSRRIFIISLSIALTGGVLFSQSLNPGVALTFDDVNINAWHSILPMLDMYNAKATFFLCCIGEINAQMESHLLDIYNAGHEIGVHGTHHTSAVAYLQNHTGQEFLEYEIFPETDYLDNLGIEYYSFCYTYGERNAETDALLLDYFDILRGTTYTWEGYEVKDNDDCYLPAQYISSQVIYGVGIDHNYGVEYEELLEGIDRARDENLILVLYCHRPSYDGNSYEIRPSYLDSVLSYIHSQNLTFYRVQDLIGAGTRPSAVISADVVSGPAPLTVSFDGSGSSDPDGIIAGYAWDFGDGNGSSLASPSHIYTLPGSYTASLTVTDNDGRTDTQSIIISVFSSTAIFEAHFDGGAEGFTYMDDAFRSTGQPGYASGTWVSSGGFSGGALQVTLGGIEDADILGMSGGFERTFSVASATEVFLRLHYNLTQTSEYETDEYSQMLVSVDGLLRGQSPHDYVAQIAGDGNGGSATSTGWGLFEVNLGTLDAGTHTLRVGGYNNKKTYTDEITTCLIDDVEISYTESTVPAGSRPDDEIMTDLCDQSLPDMYSLSRNYPNPFNAETIFEYTLPKQANVDIRIYDIVGHEVVTLISERKRAGCYMVKWNARDRNGMEVPSAVYLCRSRIGDHLFTRKITLMK